MALLVKVGVRTVAAAWLMSVLSVTAAAQNECLVCHELDPQSFAASIHGSFSCSDCHIGAELEPHPDLVEPADCADCHGGVVEIYAASVHGLARINGTVEAPACSSCHGDIHSLVSLDDPRSPVHPSLMPETCGTCHADPEMAAKFGFPISRPLEAYRDSVHARAVADDLGGATCSDCHGSHDILPALDPGSKVFHQRVPETCGACHTDISTTYENSVHGTAVARGVRDAPACSDCHGEHHVLSPSEPGSPAFPTNIPLMTCGHCHNDIRLTEKYGLSADKIPSYEESYHGLAGRAGSQTVAHCASCHGVHDILPSSDPRSHIHETNLARTCGQCHPGAGERFAIGPVHVVSTDERFPAVYYIRAAYLFLIFTTIGGMFLHNFLDLFRKFRAPPLRPPGRGKEERMMRGFRIAHGMVMVSFFVLVYTGFALTYPEAWWARPVLQWEADLALRGWLHRSAAVVLMAALAFHLLHLARSRRARQCIAKMRPTSEDWIELKERVRYFLGRRGPLHGVKVGYVEKAEYLAFVWGMAIMAVTGLLLWFENFTLRWLPTWVVDVSTAVHFYEAILATLAILVWHFYWVIFDPAVYPMDTSWWGGRPPASRELERRSSTAPPIASQDESE